MVSFLFISLLTYEFAHVYVQSHEVVNCAGIANCGCVNQNESCTLECGSWKSCDVQTAGKPITLTCTPGYPCHVNCDGGDISCYGITINGNGATSLTVTCTDWRDCESATVNCETASTCDVMCVYNPNYETNDQCENLTLNCGISACSITCHGDATVNNGGCTGIQVPNTIRPFSYECIGEVEESCIDSPAPLLPPTYDPTSDPTIEPTVPTLSPSQTPTIPTSEPTMTPTMAPTMTPTTAPTLSFETVSNITVQIVINDEDVTEDEVLDVIEDTTDGYLTTLLVAEAEYELIVSVISRVGDVLVVNIVIAVPDGVVIGFNEREVVEENENGINSQFGDKVTVNNPYDLSADTLFVEEWYFYVVIVVLLLIVLILIWYIFKRKRTINTSDTSDGIQENEMITPRDANQNIVSYTTTSRDDIGVTDGDPNVDELYSTGYATHTLNDDPEEEVEELYGKGDESEETPRMTIGTNDGN